MVGAESDTVFATLHGLYWLTSNLAARAPVVIAVDDVQWCDAGSLRFLGYLARRLEGLPLLVVTTWRTGERYADEDLVQEIAGQPDAVNVRPGPLSSDGTASVVRDRLAKADDVFVGACFRTTSGNPLLLRQLLRALEAEGIRPDASHADTVRAIGSRAVSSMVQMRLRRMPEASRDVARAIAVLGGGATLPIVAAMTGHDDDVTATAVAALARSEVLRPDLPLGFVHPLVEAAVYDDLPLGRAGDAARPGGRGAPRARWQRRSRWRRSCMQVPPRGDQSVVDVLRAAAERDVDRGSTESAIAVPQAGAGRAACRREDLPRLLMDLGRLEAMTDGMAALEHLGGGLPAARRAGRARGDRDHAGTDRGVRRAARGRDADRLGGRGRGARRALGPPAGAGRACAGVRASCTGCPSRSTSPSRCRRSRATGPVRAGSASLQAWELLCQGVDRERGHRARAVRGARAGCCSGTTRACCGWSPANMLFLAGEDTTGFWEARARQRPPHGQHVRALAAHLWHGLRACGSAATSAPACSRWPARHRADHRLEPAEHRRRCTPSRSPS